MSRRAKRSGTLAGTGFPLLPRSADESRFRHNLLTQNEPASALPWKYALAQHSARGAETIQTSTTTIGTRYSRVAPTDVGPAFLSEMRD